MSDDDFQMHVDALTLIKLQQPQSMLEECKNYWNEIGAGQYNFDRGGLYICDANVFLSTYVFILSNNDNNKNGNENRSN